MIVFNQIFSFVRLANDAHDTLVTGLFLDGSPVQCTARERNDDDDGIIEWLTVNAYLRTDDACQEACFDMQRMGVADGRVDRISRCITTPPGKSAQVKRFEIRALLVDLIRRGLASSYHGDPSM